MTDKLRRDIDKALAEPQMLEKFSAFGDEPFPIGKEAFTRYIQSESAVMADVVRTARVSLD